MAALKGIAYEALIGEIVRCATERLAAEAKPAVAT
jgi:hypothetical protein